MGVTVTTGVAILMMGSPITIVLVIGSSKVGGDCRITFAGVAGEDAGIMAELVNEMRAV